MILLSIFRALSYLPQVETEYEALLAKERDRASKNAGQLQAELTEREEAIRNREKQMLETEQRLAQAEMTIANQQKMFQSKLDTKQQFITALKDQTEELTSLLDAQTQVPTCLPPSSPPSQAAD